MHINPKCEKNEKSKDYAYSAKGFLLPCCWCDTITPEKDKELFKLFNPKLHLDNVDNIEEILLSDEWINFKQTITKDFENAPSVCKRFCGTNQQFKGVIDD